MFLVVQLREEMKEWKWKSWLQKENLVHFARTIIATKQNVKEALVMWNMKNKTYWLQILL